MTTVSEAVAAVVAERATEVFALMGNGNAYFTDALARRDAVAMTGLRHEAGVIASADAYYRITRKIAVGTTTFGPGFSNAITPLAEAVRSRTPMVYVVGAAPTSGQRPWDVDQAALAQSVGAPSLTVDVFTPMQTTIDAFDQALCDRIPVVLFIPHDIAAVPIQSAPSQGYQPKSDRPGIAIDGNDLAGIASRLKAAQRPLILAGRGARDATELLGDLADRVGALTVSSAPARGTFEGRQYDLGVCGGFASEESSALIRQADIVLAVGASLNQFTTSFDTQFGSDACVIQIDICDAPTSPRVDEFLQADSTEAISRLLTEMGSDIELMIPWRGDAEAARESRLNFERDAGTGLAPDGLLDPRSAMHRLNTILPQDRQVVSDGGHFIGWTSYYFDLPRPDSLTMVGTQYQSIGLGLPSAPGAVRARPNSTVIVATGDGGGLMGLPDLQTLVQIAGSAVVLIFNDGCYGAEIHQYGSQGLDESIMEIGDVDFTTVARGFGAKGVTVRNLEDLDKVQEWVADNAEGTLVVDLRISRGVVAPYILEIIDLTIKR